ncbi:MAG: hypothetical protein KCHDKBKB_01584 [Elusimicrobia bacterium]|nr:hypothetical protein [Elusimicrobiota bacterium]
MKTVSADYKAIQDSSLINPVRKIELFRRLATGLGWEASPIDITSEVVRLDRLSWKLDTDALNEFKASNIRIEVNNSDRLWDETSFRFSGFFLYRSRIRITLGLNVNGLEESFAVFMGVIEDVNEDSGTPTVQLDIESLDALLRTQSGDAAGILVTNELLGIGDGVISEFLTSQFPVGAVNEIRVAGEPLRPGLRYSLSNLNDPLQPGKITFISAQPGPGQEVRADYVIWKKDQEIHQVVNDLLATVPQVPVGVVEQVVFDPPVEREILHTLQNDFNLYELRGAKVAVEEAPPTGDGLVTIDAFDTKAKWQGGTPSRLNFIRVPDAITPLWTSQYEGLFLPEEEKEKVGEGSSDPWVEELNEAAGATRSVANGILSVNMPPTNLSFYHLENSKEDGSGLSRCVSVRIKVTQIDGQIEIGSFVFLTSQGAQILIQNTSQVRVQTGGSTFGPFAADLTNFRNLRLQINTSSNTWQLFIDGSQVGSGALGSAPAGASVGVYLRALAFTQMSFQLDYLRYNGSSAGLPVGTWEKIVDYGVHLAGLTSFSLINTLGPFFSEEFQGSPSFFQYFFSWSADGIGYTPEQSVSNGSNLGAFTNVTFPRFIKFKIQITGTEDSDLVAAKRLFLPALSASNVIDAGSGVVSWDTWKGTFFANDGQIQRFTAAVANSSSGFSYYQALGPGDSIETDDFAFINFAVVTEKLIFISLITTSSLIAPIQRESLIHFQTRTVLVSMANFGTQSILDVINELAKIADFEIGLDGDGAFFFRNKQASPAPVLTLDDSNVEKVNTFTPGWDRVYNKIRASFGSFVKEVDSETEGETPPTSIDRFGVRPLSVGGGNLVFQTDVDLATVMAKRYFTRYHLPKRRATLTARFMPELELGDRVTLNIASPRPIAQPFDARIVGIAHSLMDMRTELDLVEV